MAHNFSLKGLKWGLKAISLLAQKRAIPLEFWIIGRGKRNFYLNLAKSLGINKIVKFLGEQKDMELWFSAAHILLHPTYYDPCSLVCLEALASGVPIVTTRHNGVSEVLQKGGKVLEEPWHVEEMALAMEDILENWEESSQNAFAIGQKFSLEANFARLYQIFQSIEC